MNPEMTGQSSQGGEATTPSAPPSPSTSDKPSLVGQWSWAGFMFNWLYLVGHNNIALGITLFIIGIIISVIPFVNFISGLYWLGVAIFVALKGHEYAWASGIYQNTDQFNASHRVLNTMGKVAFFILIIVAILMVLFAACGLFTLGMLSKVAQQGAGGGF